MVLCREKIDTLIKFPLEGLNLSPHIRGGGISCAESEQERSAEPIYDLYAGHRFFYDLKNHHDISNPNSSLILTPNLILTRIPTITSQIPTNSEQPLWWIGFRALYGILLGAGQSRLESL
jgi:hypothetical protein